MSETAETMDEVDVLQEEHNGRYPVVNSHTQRRTPTQVRELVSGGRKGGCEWKNGRMEERQ